MSAVNGDVTNTPNWTAVKGGGTVTLGVIIKNNAATHYFANTVTGSAGSGAEPTWNTTTGATTTDNTLTWVCIGPVGTFTGGGAPHARLANALAVNWALAGNTIYWSDNSAENQSTNIVLTGASTATLPISVLCHNHSGSYPPATGDLTSGASVTATSTANITVSSPALYVQGATFALGAGGSNTNINIATAAGCWQKFVNCKFDIGSNTNANSFIRVTG
jgi:hypothetical protein